MNPLKLQKRIEQQIKRMKKSRQESSSWMSQTIYIGTLGLVMVFPIVAGAYLGHWLDSLVTEGYSMRWTLSLLLTGVVLGFFNVYFLIKEK